MSSKDQVSCPQCGRKFTWSPDLAGKKGRCKCGALVPFPLESPGAESSGSPLDAPVDEQPVSPPAPSAAADDGEIRVKPEEEESYHAPKAPPRPAKKTPPPSRPRDAEDPLGSVLGEVLSHRSSTGGENPAPAHAPPSLGGEDGAQGPRNLETLKRGGSRAPAALQTAARAGTSTPAPGSALAAALGGSSPRPQARPEGLRAIIASVIFYIWCFFLAIILIIFVCVAFLRGEGGAWFVVAMLILSQGTFIYLLAVASDFLDRNFDVGVVPLHKTLAVIMLSAIPAGACLSAVVCVASAVTGIAAVGNGSGPYGAFDDMGLYGIIASTVVHTMLFYLFALPMVRFFYGVRGREMYTAAAALLVCLVGIGLVVTGVVSVVLLVGMATGVLERSDAIEDTGPSRRATVPAPTPPPAPRMVTPEMVAAVETLRGNLDKFAAQVDLTYTPAKTLAPASGAAGISLRGKHDNSLIYGDFALGVTGGQPLEFLRAHPNLDYGSLPLDDRVAVWAAWIVHSGDGEIADESVRRMVLSLDAHGWRQRLRHLLRHPRYHQQALEVFRNQMKVDDLKWLLQDLRRAPAERARVVLAHDAFDESLVAPLVAYLSDSDPVVRLAVATELAKTRAIHARRYFADPVHRELLREVASPTCDVAVAEQLWRALDLLDPGLVHARPAPPAGMATQGLLGLDERGRLPAKSPQEQLERLLADRAAGHPVQLDANVLTYLGTAAPDVRKDQVVALLADHVLSGEAPSGIGATLQKWGGTAALDSLLPGLSSGEERVRRACRDVFVQVKDPRVLPALLAEVNTVADLAKVRPQVVAFEAAAEVEVLKLLGSSDRQRQLAAIDLISDVGTRTSLPVLTALGRAIDSRDPEEKRVATAARAAHQAITRRLRGADTDAAPVPDKRESAPKPRTPVTDDPFAP